MRVRVTVLAAAAALGVGVGVAGAVQFGEPDGGAHPFVGLMVAHQGGAPLWRCTGTLISAHRFLTAGHCVGQEAPGSAVEPDHVEIWFDEGPIATDPAYAGTCVGFVPTTTGYPCVGDVGGTPHAHPAWTGAPTLPQSYDIGMVTLDEAMAGPYGTIASLGALDGLASRRGLNDMQVVLVGYGVQSVKPVLSEVRQRLRGVAKIVSLGSSFTDGVNVRISSGPGKGNGPGGTCFGDSGGPVFHDGRVVAVNSFVLNQNCKGSGYGYRTDTLASLAFIAGFAP